MLITGICIQETFSSFPWSKKISIKCHILNPLQVLSYEQLKEGKCQLVTPASPVHLPPVTPPDAPLLNSPGE